MCKYFRGKEMDRMPDFAFRAMAAMFVLRDRLTTPGDRLGKFGILKGQTVVDYGCGTGSYLKRASELAGENGTVFAVDIHELAIKAVEKRIVRENLYNVKALLAKEEKCPLGDSAADVIYALDMFHMVSDPDSFLRELNRILKPSGSLYLSDGHQSRREARVKMLKSGCWTIEKEEKYCMHLRPVKKS